ncbi:exotoxin beta-grasp domain-containing protein [Staphylococcus chromogenes]|uniref:exotoxin beta-grasp domain-containing protein n=1 Tax=Staphylococcus chromogenes TaxID=46126 RepID=UPI003EB7B61A
MIKLPFKLFLFFLLLFIVITSSHNITLGEELNLKKKSDVNPTGLTNMNYYFENDKTRIFEETKIMNDKQFLNNNLLFTGKSHDKPYYEDILIQFNNSTLTHKYKDQEIDIYGLVYSAYCYGGAIDKTQCIYGGVTLNTGNKLEKPKNIGVNVFVDNEKQTTFVISTSKKLVTAQELDIKTRTILNSSYNIYRKNGNIQKGYISFHNNDPSKTFNYDLYDINGRQAHDFLKFYSDNQTVDSSSLHLDVYLFKSE